MARKRLEIFANRPKPLERNERVSEKRANPLKESGEFRTIANRSKGTRELQKKEQTAWKRLKKILKETREDESKEQADLELDSFSSRSKPLER